MVRGLGLAHRVVILSLVLFSFPRFIDNDRLNTFPEAGKALSLTLYYLKIVSVVVCMLSEEITLRR